MLAIQRIGDRKLVKVLPCQTKEEARQLEKKIKESGHVERFVI
jgi:predicted GIY-YIG superfamily endonuclease